jgi:hypothetical protein
MMEIKELLEVSLAYYLEKLEENPNTFFYQQYFNCNVQTEYLEFSLCSY